MGLMFSYTVYSNAGALLERTMQEGPVDVEALCAKHNLGFWKRTQYVKKFSMTTYWCYHGRINVKHIKEEGEDK
jgi:hypothetical protein